MNHLGRLHRQFLKQLLIVRAERIRPIRVHVQHAADFTADFERHGQFRFDAVPRRNVARILLDVAHARGFAGAGDPAGDAFADAQLQLHCRSRQILRRVNLQKACRGIDENNRAGRRAHEPDSFAHDQLKSLLRLQRRVDDVAHLVEQLQSLVAQGQF